MKPFIKKPALKGKKISRASSPGRTSTALDDIESRISVVEDYSDSLLETGEPVGFKSDSEVTLSIDDASRTVTVAPVGENFTYYVAGKRIVETQVKSAQWPDSHGIYFFYFNEDGDLITTDTFVDEIITRYTFVTIVYWDFAEQRHIYFANERHGVNMSTITHLYNHTTKGAAFDRGLKLLNFIVDAAGSLPTHAQFTSDLGRIWDEDLRIDIPAQTSFPVYYKLGQVWKQKQAGTFPVIHSGSVPSYAGTLLPFNSFDGANWSLTQVDNNKFVLVHVFATNNIEFPVICLQGQVQYGSKSAARDGARTELQTLTGLPFAEFAPLGSVIFEVNNSYTNAIKARIVSVDASNNYEDYRGELFRPSTL